MKKLTRSVGGKIMLFILTTIFISIFSACLIFVALCVEENIYTRTKEDFVTETVENRVHFTIENMLLELEQNGRIVNTDTTGIGYAIYSPTLKYKYWKRTGVDFDKVFEIPASINARNEYGPLVATNMKDGINWAAWDYQEYYASSYEVGYRNSYGDYQDATQFYEAGFNEGFNNGYDTAYNDAYHNGLNEGYDNGYQNGLNEGYNNGLNEGYYNGYQNGYQNGWNEANDYSYNNEYEDPAEVIYDDNSYGDYAASSDVYEYSTEIVDDDDYSDEVSTETAPHDMVEHDNIIEYPDYVKNAVPVNVLSGVGRHEKVEMENAIAENEDNNGYLVLVDVDTEAILASQYSFDAKVAEALFDYRYKVIPVGIVAFILMLICFITLMCVTARKPEDEELHPGYLSAIPYDIAVALYMSLSCLSVYMLDELASSLSDMFEIIAIVAVVFFLINMFVGFCMTTAGRIKQKNIFSHTFIWWLIKKIWWILKSIFKFIWKIIKAIHEFNQRVWTNIPILWKGILAIAAISIIELIGILACRVGGDVALFWFVEKIIIVPIIIYFMLSLKTLEKAGEKLAEGDLSYKVDTKNMISGVKKHGENLNSIAKGMTNAVELRLKSERMKTELITNVSHDIKTPLTSIINYADLIEKETKLIKNDKLKDYVEVLLRQSERLKRLINDLVEASKASTGNLEVLLAPCDANVFINQASGEYDEKLAKARLNLVVKGTDEAVNIQADGRRMWRVFDNLMNNICKYSQEGTRVYLTLTKDEEGKNAVITFKNTSKDELNISADELMERFVRGDSSRNTEGNGLGLSIARSLVELQNGKFNLDVDGDLFKVTLKFPLV